MRDSDSYIVEINGNILSGFDVDSVRAAFAELFKMPPEKAATYIGSQRVVRKGINRHQANLYKSRLENIGLEVIVQKDGEPEPPVSLQALSLVPAEEDRSTSAQPESGEHSPATLTCPKCNLEQQKSHQCAGCGVYFSKLAGFQDGVPGPVDTGSPAVSPPQRERTGNRKPLHMDYKADALPGKAIVAAGVAALVGAVIWKAIVIAVGMELGLIAWGIGGLVGYAAYLFGCHGEKAGIVCGVLALIAVFGGRYWAITSMTNDWETLAEATGLEKEAFVQVYEQERRTGLAYTATAPSRDDLPQFMIDNGYSFALEPDEVAPEEIEEFTDTVAPILQQLGSGEMDQDEWWRQMVGVAGDDYSTFDIFKDSFGFIDLLFIFLGVGTAFQLGRGRDGA